MDVIKFVKHLKNTERSRRCSCAANIAEPRGRHDFTFCAYCQSERFKAKSKAVTSKVCPRCPERGEQPREAFLVRKRNGMEALQSWCRDCMREYRNANSRKYYEAVRRRAFEKKEAARLKRQAEIDALAYSQATAYNPRITISPAKYCKRTGRLLSVRS